MKKLLFVLILPLQLMGSVYTDRGYLCETMSEALSDSKVKHIKLESNVVEDVSLADRTINIDLNGYTLDGTVLGTNCVLTIENGSVMSTNHVNKPAIRVIDSKLTLKSLNLVSTYHGVRLDGKSIGWIYGDRYELINDRSGYTLNLIYICDTSECYVSGDLYGNFDKATSWAGSNLIYVRKNARVTLNKGSFYRTRGRDIEDDGFVLIKSWENLYRDYGRYVSIGYKVEYNSTTKTRMAVWDGVTNRNTFRVR